ncbi:hypothetical protein [Sporosarcina sp. FA9]|uniref:hypothetical protein n=1 Tax=Sporosarcina sp. FA9 TaxID=3413030 RepID=UPI003F6587F9
MKDKILVTVNAIMIFAVWLFASTFLSATDEWWSFYTLNMQELSPFNVEVSWLKVFAFGFISLITSFILVRLTSR